MKLWMAPSGLHVEPGRTEDAGTLARIHAQGFAKGWGSVEFAAWLADPERTPAYVACDAKRRIEGFALFRLAGGEAELLTLAVAQKSRGKGLGAALLTAAFQDLRQTPTEEVFLEVDEGNSAALALYKKFGFSVVAKRKAYYPKPDGSTATALLMRAVLD